MFDEYVLIPKVLSAVLVGYLLGSIPFARTAARLRGVDIFSTGSHMAGTANVFWNIGRWTGTLVFVGDVAKGSAAVVIAGLLEVPAPLILLVAAAAIFGHWMSVFARFRGGDGMAPLMGVTLALEPALADHFARLARLDDTDAAEAFFDFRVADIAMGSGHFLIAAIDRSEKGMANFLANRDLPGVRAELSALREAAVRELGELAEAATIEDFMKVLENYGYDYGVELIEPQG